MVGKMLDSGSGKAVTALAWKAGLGMAMAETLQRRVGRIQPKSLVRAVPVGAYRCPRRTWNGTSPTSPSDMARTPPETVALVHRHLGDGASGWNVGVLGAIAEFNHAADDAVEMTRDAAGGRIVGSGGALRVALHGACRVVAWENLSARPGAWTHGVAFCLPAAAARRGGRSALTEHGPGHGGAQAGAPGD